MTEQKKIQVAIVDDDAKSIESLQRLFANYCPDFEIIGTANDIEAGAREILLKQPDIVFLDVEMPGGSGFDLLKILNQRDFEVIFITAHNKYAINAIKHSALDFLLKPFEVKEFLETIQKIKSNGFKDSNRYEVLLENINNNTPKKLVVSSSKGYEYIPVENIVRIESERSYARIFLAGGRVIMVSKCLNDYQSMLDDKTFFRIHNSHLVNLNHVVMYVRNDGGYVEMTDKAKIPISRSKKDIFINIMQQFIS